MTKSCLKKYSLCLNPADLVPGSPRHVSAVCTLDAFHKGSDAASLYSVRSNGKNSCSCHTSLGCKAGLHQLHPYIRKPPFQFPACEMISNNAETKVEFTVCTLYLRFCKLFAFSLGEKKKVTLELYYKANTKSLPQNPALKKKKCFKMPYVRCL